MKNIFTNSQIDPNGAVLLSNDSRIENNSSKLNLIYAACIVVGGLMGIEGGVGGCIMGALLICGLGYVIKSICLGFKADTINRSKFMNIKRLPIDEVYSESYENLTRTGYKISFVKDSIELKKNGMIYTITSDPDNALFKVTGKYDVVTSIKNKRMNAKLHNELKENVPIIVKIIQA